MGKREARTRSQEPASRVLAAAALLLSSFFFTAEPQRRRDLRGNRRIKVKTGERRGGRGNHLFSEASVAAGKRNYSLQRRRGRRRGWKLQRAGKYSLRRRDAGAVRSGEPTMGTPTRRMEPITSAPSALSGFDFRSLTNYLRSLRLCVSAVKKSLNPAGPPAPAREKLPSGRRVC